MLALYRVMRSSMVLIFASAVMTILLIWVVARQCNTACGDLGLAIIAPVVVSASTSFSVSWSASVTVSLTNSPSIVSTSSATCSIYPSSTVTTTGAPSHSVTPISIRSATNSASPSDPVGRLAPFVAESSGDGALNSTTSSSGAGAEYQHVSPANTPPTNSSTDCSDADFELTDREKQIIVSRPPNCTWAANYTCAEAKRLDGLTPLQPLANMTITFLGDSTLREQSRELFICLSGKMVESNEGINVTFYDGSVLTFRGVGSATFVRGMLDLFIPVPHCQYGAILRGVTLRKALVDPVLFKAAIGDILVFGAAMWNMGKDHVAALLRPNPDNGGHVRYNTTEDLVANYIVEVEALAAFVRALPEPWRSDLLPRLWWRSSYPVESVASVFPAQTNAVLGRANEAAAAAWHSAGIGGIVDVFRLRDTKWRPSVNASYSYTRDGVHPLSEVYHIGARIALSQLVRAGLHPLPALTEAQKLATCTAVSNQR